MVGRPGLAAVLERDGHSFPGNCKQEITSLYQFDLELDRVQ